MSFNQRAPCSASSPLKLALTPRCLQVHSSPVILLPLEIQALQMQLGDLCPLRTGTRLHSCVLDLRNVGFTCDAEVIDGVLPPLRVRVTVLAGAKVGESGCRFLFFFSHLF